MVNFIDPGPLRPEDEDEDQPQDSYELLEKSADGQMPVEYYHFTDGSENYFYTSGEFEVLFRGQRWLPLQIDRGTIRAGSSEASDFSLNVKIPSSCEFAQRYAHVAVTQDLYLTIYKNFMHILDEDAIVIWSGKVLRISSEDHSTTLTIPNKLSYYFTGGFPSVYYQSICNHVLYDARCGIKKEDHTFDITVTSVDRNVIGYSGKNFSKDELKGGMLYYPKTKENRLITENDGNFFAINYPLVFLATGEKCSVIHGCDHSKDTCKNFFKNIKNFGGHYGIPKENLFDGDIG